MEEGRRTKGSCAELAAKQRGQNVSISRTRVLLCLDSGQLAKGQTNGKKTGWQDTKIRGAMRQRVSRRGSKTSEGWQEKKNQLCCHWAARQGFSPPVSSVARDYVRRDGGDKIVRCQPKGIHHERCICRRAAFESPEQNHEACNRASTNAGWTRRWVVTLTVGQLAST